MSSNVGDAARTLVVKPAAYSACVVFGDDSLVRFSNVLDASEEPVVLSVPAQATRKQIRNKGTIKFKCFILIMKKKPWSR